MGAHTGGLHFGIWRLYLVRWQQESAGADMSALIDVAFPLPLACPSTLFTVVTNPGEALAHVRALNHGVPVSWVQTPTPHRKETLLNIKNAVRRRFRYAAEVTFNWVGTYIPSHTLRQLWMASAGASIAPGTSIFMGTTIFGGDNLRIGRDSSIGFRCVLDARGGLIVGDRVVIASDVQIITGSHEVNSSDFRAIFRPVTICDSAWVASRATILQGCRVGAGAVVAAAALVREDVAPMDLVVGVPAKSVGQRSSDLDYNPRYRPKFY